MIVVVYPIIINENTIHNCVINVISDYENNRIPMLTNNVCKCLLFR